MLRKGLVDRRGKRREHRICKGPDNPSGALGSMSQIDLGELVMIRSRQEGN